MDSMGIQASSFMIGVPPVYKFLFTPSLGLSHKHILYVDYDHKDVTLDGRRLLYDLVDGLLAVHDGRYHR